METLARGVDQTTKTVQQGFALEYAADLASKLVEEIEPHVHSVIIAGSIRRRRPVVKDIDLVVIADDRLKLYQYLLEQGYKLRSNVHEAEHYWKFIYHDMSVDVFWATVETLPAILLVRTGPKHHNIHLVNRAKQLGKRFATSIGIYTKDGDLIKTENEADIYRALGMVYHRATERDQIGKREY